MKKNNNYQVFVFIFVFNIFCESSAQAVAPYNLGTIPSSVEVRWPAAPLIQRTVEVFSANEFNTEAAVEGTKIIVRENLTSDVSISANNIFVVASSQIQFRKLSIYKGKSRIKIKGGQFTEIVLPIPADFGSTTTWNEAWMVKNVMIDSVKIVSNDTALALRGKRIAVLNSFLQAERYSVWGGDTGGFKNAHYILANNKFKSAGPESTVRIYSSLNGIVIDNVFKNGVDVGHKHNLRFHGESENIFVRGNWFINSGTMHGTMAGDSINRFWLNGNVFYHNSDQLLGLAGPDIIQNLTIKNNTAYSATWGCFTCGQSGPTWTFQNNPVNSYQSPPPEKDI